MYFNSFYKFPVLPEVTEVCINYSKTCTCESCVVRNQRLLQPGFTVHAGKHFVPCSMTEPGHYPPPDFGCPPPNSIQHQQQQPRSSSSFHPSMWSWCETPSEPSWGHSGQAGWYQGEAAGFGSPTGRGNYGPKRPYGGLLV